MSPVLLLQVLLAGHAPAQHPIQCESSYEVDNVHLLLDDTAAARRATSVVAMLAPTVFGLLAVATNASTFLEYVVCYRAFGDTGGAGLAVAC